MNRSYHIKPLPSGDMYSATLLEWDPEDTRMGWVTVIPVYDNDYDALKEKAVLWITGSKTNG